MKKIKFQNYLNFYNNINKILKSIEYYSFDDSHIYQTISKLAEINIPEIHSNIFIIS